MAVLVASRRVFRLGLCLTAMLLSACSPPATRLVVLISIDSLRADHLGAYGYARETSPRIDALAAEGLVIERAISSTSWTLPAHVALFTGLGDSLHGVVDDGLALGPGPKTLAESLRDRGFATGAVVSGPYLHRGFGLDRGFDDYMNCMGFLDDEFNSESRAAIGLRDLYDRSHLDITSPCVAERASDWIRQHRGQSAFLFVHFWDVHYDYLAPEEFVQRFDPDYEGDLDASDFELSDAIAADMDPRDLQHLIALYDGEIAFVDEHLGHILDVIDETGSLDETLVIVTADHGEAFFDHEVKGHRKNLHAEAVRIPMILRGPGVPASTRLPGVAHITDVAPTVLELVGAPRQEEDSRATGRSLVPGFVDPDALVGRWVASELETPTLSEIAIESLGEKIMLDRRSGRVRAFDLLSDPLETRPLPPSEEMLDRVQDHYRRLEERKGKVPAVPFGTPPPELEEKLRSLGYID